ncbi:dehydrogenase/reductase SDR family member 11-like [Schistocerca serialis cubense]|uniref:dehydrogenase/reductase SDR family member 11-like n=1 Tax=Schistocerca serialis cubense TaxID=2023355 RepID=UPI00214EAC3D|nr:dehydrogenase/reductase SDR family member 11-like [Schistocerca serialis cubense]XP_049948561.1 dehydrogenase/reductase SDR family member 11-like [Schistocerca serialis cubense]
MGIEKYKGRVALVTGASAGIGAAIVQALLKHGLTVVGMARRAQKVKELALKDAPGKLHAIAGDVSDEASILAAFKWVKDNLGGVDVLINNAGVFPTTGLIDGKTKDWKSILDVNVLGLSICTREAVQDMLGRGVDDGFIIHINSLAGHILPSIDGFAMYSSSKHAVKILLEGLRKDLVARGSKIRVGEVSPGLVWTEGAANIAAAPPEGYEFFRNLKQQPALQPEDLAEAVVYMLSQHPRVQVHDIIIMPTGQQS